MKRILAAAFTFALPAFAGAQTTVVEASPQPLLPNLPIERDEAGVVKAQYIKPGDVTPEEYQALLDEADRIRAYRGETAPRYTVIGADVPPAAVPPAAVPEPVAAASATIPSRTYTVMGGDTLYGIAKRFGVDVSTLTSANAMSGTAIKIGQVLRIPVHAGLRSNTDLSTLNTQAPVFLASTPQAASSAAATFALSTTYVVLPGDTLYSISKRACVDVNALQSANSLGGNAIRPGQQLAVPDGHCL